MKKLLIIISITLSFNTFAETLKTNNSKLILNGNVDKSVQWIMIKATNESDGLSNNEIISAINGHYYANLYLKDGAGKYTVELFQNSNDNKYTSYTRFQVLNAENLDTRDTKYLLPSENVQSDDSIIIDLAQSLTTGVANKQEAIKNIHDYIVSNISYDYESYKSGSYVNNPYDALTVLENKKSICSGYANLFAALARSVGIKSKIINGKVTISNGTADHAWNEVFINGEWKIIDSTWDAGLNSYKYYFPTAKEFAIDHKAESIREDL